MENSDRPVSEITKREHFAGLAMKEFISAGRQGMPSSVVLACLAVKYADAVLKELEK